MLFIIETKPVSVGWYFREGVMWIQRYAGILFVCGGCSWKEEGKGEVVDKINVAV